MKKMPLLLMIKITMTAAAVLLAVAAVAAVTVVAVVVAPAPALVAGRDDGGREVGGRGGAEPSGPWSLHAPDPLESQGC